VIACTLSQLDWDRSIEALERGEIHSIDDLLVIEAAILLSMEESARRRGSDSASDSSHESIDAFPFLNALMSQNRAQDIVDDDSDDLSSENRTSRRRRRRRRGRNASGLPLSAMTEDEQVAIAIALSLRDAEQGPPNNSSENSSSVAESNETESCH